MGRKDARSDIRERLGFAIKTRREQVGLTQEKLAEKAGIHRTYIGDVERGARNIGVMNVERVAIALSIRISELFQLAEKG